VILGAGTSGPQPPIRPAGINSTSSGPNRVSFSWYSPKWAICHSAAHLNGPEYVAHDQSISAKAPTARTRAIVRRNGIPVTLAAKNERRVRQIPGRARTRERIVPRALACRKRHWCPSVSAGSRRQHYFVALVARPGLARWSRAPAPRAGRAPRPRALVARPDT